jgi:sulfur carrier protein ThiS
MGTGSVKVGKVPGRITEVNIVDGETTVREAIQLAGLSLEAGYSARLNGDVADLDEVLEDGDSVTLVKEVKGN